MSGSTEEPRDPYEELGERARLEVDKARKDPRLERGRAAVADFWDAMDEAERVRKLAIRGSEMIRASDPVWAMAELAGGDIENDFPGLNAQALIAMNSALDSMVEEFAPAMREILVKASSTKRSSRRSNRFPTLLPTSMPRDAICCVRRSKRRPPTCSRSSIDCSAAVPSATRSDLVAWVSRPLKTAQFPEISMRRLRS